MSLASQIIPTGPSDLVLSDQKKGIVIDPLALWRSYLSNTTINDVERHRLSAKSDAWHHRQRSRRTNRIQSAVSILADAQETHSIAATLKDDLETYHRPLHGLTTAMMALMHSFISSDDGQVKGTHPFPYLDMAKKAWSNSSIITSDDGVNIDTTIMDDPSAKSSVFSAKAKLQSWASMPVDELQTRMNKGEQLHIDEWMPGSGRKRPLLSAEVKATLDLASDLNTQGSEAFNSWIQSKKSDSNAITMANVRYTQGVRTVEWVHCDPSEHNRDELQFELDELESKLLRNAAWASYHLGNYRDGLGYANRAIESDPEDHKAIYRRGLISLMLSDIASASNDFKFLIKVADHPQVNAAGRDGLAKVRRIVNNYKSDARQWLEHITEESIFSEHRASPKLSNNPISKGDDVHPSHIQRHHSKDRCDPLNRLLTNIQATENYLPHHRPTYQEMTDILDGILKFYTDEEIISLLNRYRLESDFNAKRYLIRTRKDFVPLFCSATLRKAQSLEPWWHLTDYTLNQYFQRMVQYYRAIERLASTFASTEFFGSVEVDIRAGRYLELLPLPSNPFIPSSEMIRSYPSYLTKMADETQKIFWGDIETIEEEE